MKLILFALLALCACQPAQVKHTAADSMLASDYYSQDFRDSAIHQIKKDALFDTAGISKAPVRVTKFWLKKGDYSNYKDVSFTFKNVSDKRIEAVRFRWYGLDAFGEPAELGNPMLEGFGGGFDDDAIGLNKSRTVTYGIMSRNAKKLILVWPIEIAFADGTTWKAL